jgi:hypothetical protein
MKNIYSKLAVGLFALIVGVWIGDGFRPLTSFFSKPQKPVAEESVPVPAPITEINGKIQLRFIKFTQSKDLLADFEIVNGTDYPVIYAGYRWYTRNFEEDKNNFCNLVTKQGEKWGFVETSNCFGAMRKTLLTLKPGERAIFSVAKWDVKKSLDLPAVQPEITTQIGFEIYTGKDQEKQILWTDELKFPETLH